MYRIQAFNGDPHPGNYLFMDDGRIAFLDYGLVKYFDDADIAEFEVLIRSMLVGDAARFRSTLEAGDLLRAGAPFSDSEVYDWFSHYYDIVMHPGSHTITSEYASSMVRYNFDARSNAMLKWANIPARLRPDPANQPRPLRHPRTPERNVRLSLRRRRTLAMDQRRPLNPPRSPRNHLARHQIVPSHPELSPKTQAPACEIGDRTELSPKTQGGTCEIGDTSTGWAAIANAKG